MTLQYRHQPLKAFYLAYETLATVFLKLPVWVIIALPKSWRPVPTRSFGHTILIHLISHLVNVMNKTGPLTHEPSFRALEGEDGIWVDPAPQLIVDELKTWASVASVESVRIPGYFFGTRNESYASCSQKLVYSLHGGAYVQCSAHPSGPNSTIARALLSKVVTTVFAVEYRLSTTNPLVSSNPFPAALLDALAGYNYLIDSIGISPSNIIVEGDSSGGNLALALTRYLVEHTATQGIPPPPGGLLLLSPWCDIGLSHDVPRSKTILKADYDPEPNGMDYAKEAFVGPHGMGAADLNPYISPGSLHPSLSVSFKGFPKTFICAGGAENLYPQIQVLKERMMRDNDQRVTYWEGQDEPHDYLLFPSLSPTWEATVKAISDWVSDL